MSRFALVGSSICILFLAGCGAKVPVDVDVVPCHPASGSLLVGNKAPKEATLIFVPKKAEPNSKVPRPRATVEDDGSFKIRTYGNDDGAPVGEYGLIIIFAGHKPSDQLDGRYSTPEKTAVTVKIAEGKNEIPPLKLK